MKPTSYFTAADDLPGLRLGDAVMVVGRKPELRVITAIVGAKKADLIAMKGCR